MVFAATNETLNRKSPSPPNPLSQRERGLGGEGEGVGGEGEGLNPHRAEYKSVRASRKIFRLVSFFIRRARRLHTKIVSEPRWFARGVFNASTRFVHSRCTGLAGNPPDL